MGYGRYRMNAEIQAGSDVRPTVYERHFNGHPCDENEQNIADSCQPAALLGERLLKVSRPKARRWCRLGYHRRTAVNWHQDRAFSECGYCGQDLVRSRRGWRGARQDELPEEWRTHRDVAEPSSGGRLRWVPIMAASMLFVVGLALIATLQFA